VDGSREFASADPGRPATLSVRVDGAAAP
ncbi:MAG: hypothetical protein JWM15_465, partial [Cryptosporangiaceae bacterium]|nr:hypothetical protein [Cryptosporangiaceae bacterium]